MFRKVLIANRGEIASRIAATLREMGVRSVAVCSDADRGAMHTRVADEVRAIGAAEPRASYLDAAGLVRAAEKLGYPVMIKAALGGGGKGMRAAAGVAELREGIEGARRVALSGFGDASVYLEKRIERARHVEVQVAGDGRGEVVHFFE